MVVLNWGGSPSTQVDPTSNADVLAGLDFRSNECGWDLPEDEGGNNWWGHTKRINLKTE